MHSSKKIAKDLIDAVLRGADADVLALALSEKIKDSSQAAQLPHILFYLKEYQKRRSESESFRVESATEISEDHLSKLTQTFAAEGSTLRVSLDPDLIAGFRVRHKDQMYDATLSTRLNKLKEALI